MKEFEVVIEERVSQSFYVKADSLEQAMEIAEEKYNNEEFVLEPGNINGKSMVAIDNETNEMTEWVEF